LGNDVRTEEWCVGWKALGNDVRTEEWCVGWKALGKNTIFRKKVKVKVTLVQALRLCTGRTAHRGSRVIALVFHDQRH